MRYRYPLLWVISLVFLLVAAACAQTALPTPSPTKPAAATAAPTKPAAPVASPTTAAGGQSGAPKAPMPVKMGGIGSLGGIAIYLASHKGYFEEQGLAVEYVNFQTGANMIPALGQGQIDAGAGAINAGLFNAIARDITLRMIAEPTTNERDQGLMVRADLANQIKDWADLKGRKVALSGTASSVEINLEAALKKGGLTLKDVQVETMGFPDMVTAMANKAVEVAYVTEPTVSQGIDKGVMVRWKLAGEIYPGHQIGVLMLSSKFVTENPDAGRRLMLAILKGGRDFYEFTQTGKDKQTVIAAATKYSTLKDPKVFEAMYWPSIDPDMRVKTKSIQADLDWYVQKGNVKEAPDLTKAIDDSFVNYAVQQLGPYKR